MLVRVVGLGPGDPALLTVGSLDALRSAGRAVLLLAPPEMVKYLTSHGIDVVRTRIDDAGLVVRGSREHIERFVAELEAADIAIGVLGNPLSDFAGLPLLLRALERRGAKNSIVPGMPRETLSAALNMPLVPLPPGSAHHTWDDLVEIMARLRLSCPWDREQTHRTLIPYLIEEAYEVVEAIEHNNQAGLCEELGDLLLQIVFHSQLATETGRFSVADVIDALSNKMVRRHPHVFGDAVIEDVDAQWKNWERLKAEEATGKARASRLDGIPRALGALQRGQRMQEKAARIGFDWPGPKEVLEKLGEELAELAQAQREHQDDAHVREELGDVFFTLVNLTRALGIDAETAMREANEKFYRRFFFMERRATMQGRELSEMSLDELEELWQLAKIEAA
ncbi:MAG: nucleoside triphosphate pyrophosphohydrolase [Candidatus Eremiobacteraeota bacterium]|nr:nucleoside triphosphate pyrophosphohydrolase [Candidatus Eremiobacteraeota bacterium]